jgi:hypothetical protein
MDCATEKLDWPQKGAKSQARQAVTEDELTTKDHRAASRNQRN